MGDSSYAALDRDLFTVMDVAADPAERSRLAAMLLALTEPAALALGHAFYARLDQLTGAEPDDPRVAMLAMDIAEHLVEHLPVELTAMMLANADDATSRDWLAVMSRDMAPAQAEVLRQLLQVLRKRRC